MGHSLTEKVLLDSYLVQSILKLTKRDMLGRFLYENLIPDRKLSKAASFLEGEEKKSFSDLARRMLVWHPDMRKTAGELAGHLFLQPKETKS